jgi:glutaredoxin
MTGIKLKNEYRNALSFFLISILYLITYWQERRAVTMRISANPTSLAALLLAIGATDAFTAFSLGSRTFLSKSAVPLFDSKESIPAKINGDILSQEAVFPVEESTEKTGSVAIVDEYTPVANDIETEEEPEAEFEAPAVVQEAVVEVPEAVVPETTVESEETVKEPTLEEPKSEDADHVTVVESVEEPKEEPEPPVIEEPEEESEAPVVVQEAVVEEPEVEETKLEEPKPAESIEVIEEAKNEPAIVEAASEPTFFDGLKAGFRIFQESQAAGYDFKQCVACVLAGEYDGEGAREEINDIIKSNPCVMYTWESSPACKKAVEAFEKVGAEVKNVRLDDPWSEGNPIRAEIGKMVGKSSVPMIFIGGKYVGGYDAGVSEEAPGILEMAFKGTLRPKLHAAGAFKAGMAEVEQ